MDADKILQTLKNAPGLKNIFRQAEEAESLYKKRREAFEEIKKLETEYEPEKNKLEAEIEKATKRLAEVTPPFKEAKKELGHRRMRLTTFYVENQGRRETLKTFLISTANPKLEERIKALRDEQKKLPELYRREERKFPDPQNPRYMKTETIDNSAEIAKRREEIETRIAELRRAQTDPELEEKLLQEKA